jgi:hypothetical protein
MNLFFTLCRSQHVPSYVDIDDDTPAFLRPRMRALQAHAQAEAQRKAEQSAPPKKPTDVR